MKNPFNSTNSRYIVRNGTHTYSKIISTHRTLGEAYKTLVRHHKARYKHNKFPMAQEVTSIIATQEPNKIIKEDIQFWLRLDGMGPRPKRRLPLPIVVHQWNPTYKVYLRFGERS